MSRHAAAVLPISALLALGLAGCTAGASESDDGSRFPEGNITLIVPTSAGGGTDIAARSINGCLSTELGVDVRIENRPGASAVGIGHVARATADGLTILAVQEDLPALSPLQVDNVGYEADDLVLISPIYQVPTLLWSASEFTTPEEFFENGTAQDPVTIGDPGASTVLHLSLRLLAQEGHAVEAVPFDSGSESSAAALGGHVDAYIAVANEAQLSMIEDGTIRPVAIGADSRAETFPDVPTLAELGMPTLVDLETKFSIFAPADVPVDAQETLQAAIYTCFDEPEVYEALGDGLFVPQAAANGETITSLQEAYADRTSKLTELVAAVE